MPRTCHLLRRLHSPPEQMCRRLKFNDSNVRAISILAGWQSLKDTRFNYFSLFGKIWNDEPDEKKGKIVRKLWKGKETEEKNICSRSSDKRRARSWIEKTDKGRVRDKICDNSWGIYYKESIQARKVKSMLYKKNCSMREWMDGWGKNFHNQVPSWHFLVSWSNKLSIYFSLFDVP